MDCECGMHSFLVSKGLITALVYFKLSGRDSTHHGQEIHTHRW